MTEYDSQIGNTESIRSQVFKILDKQPLNTASYLARLLKLPYKKYQGYLNKLRYDWKYHHENERGSNRSNSHCCKYVGLVKVGEADRLDAVNKCWELSRARNRFLVFHDPGRLGRVCWFETGTIVLNVRRLANEGKAKQLFCNAFFASGLISDVKVLDACVNRIHVHSGHTVFSTPQRLPKTTIDAFADSHGITIKIGDRSHPNGIEILWEVQEQVEKLGNLAEGFAKFMGEFQGLLGQGNGVKNGSDVKVSNENIGVV